MSRKPDYDALKRAICGGVAEAAREAGCRYVMLDIDVAELPEAGAGVKVVLRGLTPEQAEQFASYMRDLQEQRN